MATLAVVGAAHIHTPEFLEQLIEHGDVEPAGIFDHDERRARELADRFAVPVLASPAEAYDDAMVDGVMVTSETIRHRTLAVRAAESGKALFVEKPVGATAEDARAIADAVERTGVVFQTGYFLRGDPAHRALRELIEEGALGELNRVRVANTNPSVLLGWLDDFGWMTEPAQAGVGAWGDEGAHAVDLLRWLTGREVQRVMLALGTVTGRYGDVDEHGEALLELDGDVLATVGAGWVDRGDIVQLEVAGREGHAWVAGRRLWVVSERLAGADGSEPWADLPDPLPHAFTLFLDALAGRPHVPLVGARDAAAVTAILQAAYEAAERGTWARPSPTA